MPVPVATEVAAERVNTAHPHVSVCIPTYNRSGYLRAALDSALAQTYRDFELLVVDNGSTDDTAAVVAGYAAQDRRVCYRRNPRNLGVVGNWNRCLALAQGAYIALLHDDDLWLPTTLQTLVGALDAHPAAGFAYGVAEEIDDTGRPVGLRRSRGGDGLLAPAVAFAHLLAFNSVPPPAVLVRATAYATAGPYDPTIGSAIDWEMWLRLASRYPVVYVDRVVAKYRLTEESVTKCVEADGSAAVSMRATVAKALAAPPGGQRPPRRVVRRAHGWVARFELSLAAAFLYQGDHVAFRRHALAALRFAPELLVTQEGLSALALSVASLTGPHGPRVMWKLRDHLLRLSRAGRRSTAPAS
ncbi:MAG: glycosyltransferase family 2 protein [Chloroflexota bacterium]